MNHKNKKILGVCFFLIFLFYQNQVLKAQEVPTCGQEPADVVIMLDRTGSISSSDRANEIAAANSLISKFADLNNGQRVAIGHFGKSSVDTNAEIVTSLTTVTPLNLATLQANVSSALSSSGGGTDISSAISLAQAELTANATTSNHVIILVSDGQANRPSPDSNAATQALNAATNAKGTGTTIISIAYGDNGHSSIEVSGRALLAQIATQPSADNHTTSAHDVTVAERDAENNDADDFFIAPSNSGLTTLFNQISDAITCNDNDPCTVDTCGNGNMCNYQSVEGCVACQNNSNCNDENPCTTDTCGMDHTCHHVDLENGTSCNDGNFCTTDTTCQNGACGGGNPVSCTALDACHNVGTCNPGTGLCSNPTKEDGSSCGDDNACNGSESCQQGTCVPGTPVVVDDNNPCTTDYCGSDGLAHHDNVEDGTLCNDDYNACDGVTACQQGSCVEVTSPVVCSALDSCHTIGTCDTATGICSNPAKENGTSCADENICNGNESCQNGECIAGTAINCDDGNSCTRDSCGEGGSCSHEPIVGTTECPGSPVCGNGVVESGEECDDGNVIDGDKCESNCTLPTCGNGVVDSSLEEECDDGAQNGSIGDLCSSNCTLETPATPAITPSPFIASLEGSATSRGGCELSNQSESISKSYVMFLSLGLLLSCLVFLRKSKTISIENKKL